MSRNDGGTWGIIHGYCVWKEWKEEEDYEKTKKILKLYRSVCWATKNRADAAREENEMLCGTGLDAALIYLEAFAPYKMQEQFENRIGSLFQTRWLIERVEETVCRVKEYPGLGTLYYDILFRAYFSFFPYTESEILEELHIERSRYYDRKKEAIFLFGILFWGEILPETRERSVEKAETNHC